MLRRAQDNNKAGAGRDVWLSVTVLSGLLECNKKEGMLSSCGLFCARLRRTYLPKFRGVASMSLTKGRPASAEEKGAMYSPA